MKPKPITRQVISEFSTRSSATKLYKEGTAEYDSNIESIFCDLQDYKPVSWADEIFEQDGKFGVRNDALGVLIPPIYDEICEHIVGVYVAKLNDKFGIVKADCKGSIIYPFELDEVDNTEAMFYGLLIARNGKWGAVSVIYGRVVTIIEPIYDNIISVKRYDGHEACDLLLLEKEGKRGLFFDGDIVPALYDEISIPIVMGWIRAKAKRVWYYIDSELNPTTDVNKAFLTYSDYTYFPTMREDE